MPRRKPQGYSPSKHFRHLLKDDVSVGMCRSQTSDVCTEISVKTSFQRTNFCGKPDQHSNLSLSPLSTRLTQNNEKRVVENGRLEPEHKMVTGKTEGDANNYLHKKFKKVATLEETSPAKVRCEKEDEGLSSGARYLCPYCKQAFAKPSVLQKHIRAHTNERPYPCHPCGFAFKTKSNLYKHCRSRAHTLKMDPSEAGSSEEEEAEARLEVRRPYKPKFHTAAIYTEDEGRIPASPSPDYLQRRISRLISENQAIVDEVSWPMKPRHRDTPPASPVLKNGVSDAAHSKLALALLRPHRAGTPELGEPLNLTVKEPRKRSISESRTDNFIKDILLKAHSAGSLGEREEPTLLCPHCKASFKSPDNLEIHLYCCLEKQNEKILMSPGPLLGNTPLVELQKEEPNLKRRKLDLHLQEAMNSPGKSVHLFGGEVLINDKGGKTKTLRIESSKKEYVNCSEKKTEEEQQVVMISKTGLHCAGGTMIQTGAPSPRSPSGDRLVLPIKPTVLTPTLSVPGLSAPVQVPLPLNPLTSITAFNPLTLPTPSTGGGGLLTILHGGRPIPYVPGMPGPNTLLSQPPLLPKKCDKPPSVIVKTTKTDLPPPPPPPKLDEDKKDIEESKNPPPAIPPSCTEPPTTTTGEKKFARPSSLPLKPGTYTPKRNPTTPHLTLVSPETPRPRKSYGQLYLNGHAYTYLGLKCSTRTFFCTLNKTQPTYVSLFPDQYKVSMYSNWTICSDSNPHPLGLETRRAMGLYDSRNKTGIYTVANRNKNDIITHSSYHSSPGTSTSSSSGDTSPRQEKSCLTTEIGQKRVKVCEGGFESNEEYTYVRGRGKGRYVCEECGIRCKKPSMLKKHIQTHTDLRPYTCKHCVFSFKTKGNLTKHMKSKAHFKKCIELGIFPVPSSVDDSIEDDNELKVDDDYSHGSNGEESDEESDDEDDEEEDDDDEDDEFSDDEGEDCKTRRDVARSLLTLSEVTLETAHRQYVNAGLVPTNFRPRTFPYTLVSTQEVEPIVEKVTPQEGSCWGGSPEPISLDTNDSSMSTEDSIDLEPPEPYTPIDLSNKTLPGGSVQATVISSVGGQMSLLKSLCTTTDKTEAGTGQTGGGSSVEDSTLLHTYLTERAVRESHLKEKQREEPGSLETTAGAKAKESALGVLALSLQSGRPPSPRKAEFIPAQSGPSPSFISSTEDGRSMCGVCNKVFNKPSQLRLHVNIHYFERPFRCDACAVSFRSKGHLQKHQRSLSHLNKVNMNSTFGTATSSNPRPFKCDDCKIAFRIHGHLAKHLRSKMHIMKLECLGKLPFGTYAELERSGTNMNDIDTTDCDNSLESLQILAKKLCENDPSKLSTWAEPGLGDSSSEEEPDPTCYKTDTSSSSINQNMCQPRHEAAHSRSSLSTEQDDVLSLSLR